MDLDLVLLGERIKERRSENRMTQEAACDATGLDQSYWSQLEGGKISNPGLRTIQKVAHALGTSMAYLVGETDDPRPPSKADAAAPNREEGMKDGDPIPPDLQLNLERAMFRALEKWEKERRRQGGSED